MDQKTYHQTLPKKRISAGCLLFDEDQRLLVVNPTYKDTWEIPGGVVERNESPRDGVMREIMEELGIECLPTRLLCVDYSGESDSRTESLQFIFLGPKLTTDMIAAIRPAAGELSEYQLLEPPAAVKLLNKKLRRRVQHCLEAIKRQETLYLEEQQLVEKFVPR
jgi:8-oxo-dGTP diphosphatase